MYDSKLARIILGLLLLLTTASILQAQDVLTVGGGTCIVSTGAPGAVVNVPVYIRDVSGTALGMDLAAANRIQNFAFQVTPSNAAAIATDSGGSLLADVTDAGVTAGRTHNVGWGTVTTATDFSFIGAYKATSPLTFTLDKAAPGDLIANIAITLSAAATPGTVINLVIKPAAAQTGLSNAGGTVSESVGAGLSLVNGCIMVPATLPDWGWGFASGGTVSPTDHVYGRATIVNHANSTVPLNLNHIAYGLTTRTLNGSYDCNGCNYLDGFGHDEPFPWTQFNNTIRSVVLAPGQSYSIDLVTETPQYSAGASPGSYVLPVTLQLQDPDTAAMLSTITNSLTWTVSAATPVIVSFAASPPTITAGHSSTLSWTTTNATSVSIDNGVGSQAVNGSVSVSPAGTTTYVLTATNAAGSSVNGSATITVTTPGKLQILLPGETAAPLTASGKTGSPRPQIAGTPFNVIVNLVDANWNVVNTAANTVVITSSDPSAALPPSAGLTAGSRTFAVTLNTSGNQTLTATDLSDPNTVAASGGPVAVLAKNTAVIAVASLPAGMVSTPDTGGALDSYTLVNTGGSATTITLTQSGNFFSQMPTSFTLAPGQSQQVTITSAAQPARSEPYTGSSIPSGEGVPSGLSIPIKLLVASPPAGNPHVVPSEVRIDTSELVTTGTAEFHNDGTATATGIFVTDVPWLIPQSAPLTIAAGGSATGTFTIDRSLRPDANGPLGSQTAHFTFVYFTGSGSSQGVPATVLATTPPTGNAIVTLVDTAGVNRGTSQGVPPLASGEVARFVAGVPHKLGNIADVSFVNAGASALPSSLIYFVPSGFSSLFAQAASVSQLSSNAPVGLGDVVSTVFRNDATTGSLQFRSKTSDLLAIGAMLWNQTSQGRLGTALSVFRSDQASAAGQDWYLAGVRKDATTHTDLYVQETAGFPATIQLEFFDAGGASVAPGRSPDSVPSFGQLELLDVVPVGAVAARITNNPGSNAKVVAEAHVVENGGDVWNIVDSTRQAGWSRSEPVVIPFAASVRSGSGGYTATDLFITNTSAAAAAGDLALPSGVSRRRATRTSARSASAAGAEPLGSTQQSYSFAPHQTRVLTDVLRSSTGLSKEGRASIMFTPTSGEFVVTSRTYVSVPGQSQTVGSSVPGIARASAMKAGDARHVAGLEDASPKTLAAAAPGTFRTSVGLLETAGKDVTVSLTVRYMYAYQLTTQLPHPASADFALKANQLLVIDDLVRSIIGSQRDQYGDLHNVQLDVEIASGAGVVIPFALSTDNGSGDFSFIPIP